MPSPRPDLLRRLLSEERGITIVEAMMAAAILLTGLIAGFLALDSASGATKTAERQAIAASVGEREIERLQSMPYAELVHCAAPASTTDPGAGNGEVPENPHYYVKPPVAPDTTYRFEVKANFRDVASGPLAGTPAAGESLVVQSSTPCNASRTNAVFAGPIAFSSGGISGEYWRFVTWRDETCLPDLPLGLQTLLNGASGLISGLLTAIKNAVGVGVNAFCTLPQDTKRITVAVVVDDAGDLGPHKPIWLSSIQTDAANGLIIDDHGRFDF